MASAPRPAAAYASSSSVASVLPAGLLLHEIGQDRNGLVVVAVADVEPGEHRAQVGVGEPDGLEQRTLEVMDGPGPGSLAGRHVRRAAEGWSPSRRRWCRARGAPLASRGETLSACSAVVDGLRQALLPQVQVRERGDDLRRFRVERHRPPVGGNGALGVVVVLEAVRQQELRVGFRDRVRRLSCLGGLLGCPGFGRRRPLSRARRGRALSYAGIVPQKDGGVI